MLYGSSVSSLRPESSASTSQVIEANLVEQLQVTAALQPPLGATTIVADEPILIVPSLSIVA